MGRRGSGRKEEHEERGARALGERGEEGVGRKSPSRGKEQEQKAGSAPGEGRSRGTYDVLEWFIRWNGL